VFSNGEDGVPEVFEGGGNVLNDAEEARCGGDENDIERKYPEWRACTEYRNVKPEQRAGPPSAATNLNPVAGGVEERIIICSGSGGD